MRNLYLCLMAGVLIFTVIYCNKDHVDKTNAPISAVTLQKIKALGFNIADVKRFMDGYLVEGDVMISEKDVDAKVSGPVLRIGQIEQYRVVNLVTGLPRVIKIRVGSSLGSAYVAGTDTAIAQYNRAGLTISFVRITSGTADITISGFNEGPSGGVINYGSSGFPTNGNPYSSILMNTNSQAYGSTPYIMGIACVILHEIGHCIGFRHTDYLDRSFSCGGAPTNEGVSVGAIWIPGTPAVPTLSFMQACHNGGACAFTASDLVALRYLY